MQYQVRIQGNSSKLRPQQQFPRTYTRHLYKPTSSHTCSIPQPPTTKKSLPYHHKRLYNRSTQLRQKYIPSCRNFPQKRRVQKHNRFQRRMQQAQQQMRTIQGRPSPEAFRLFHRTRQVRSNRMFHQQPHQKRTIQQRRPIQPQFRTIT